MVFYDSSGAIGNGTDIMAFRRPNSDWKKSTDVTSFIGEVNVPNPTKENMLLQKNILIRVQL